MASKYIHTYGCKATRRVKTAKAAVKNVKSATQSFARMIKPYVCIWRQ